MTTFKAVVNDKEVYVSVVELDDFFHAGPEEQVFVQEADGSQYIVRKGDLTNLSIDRYVS